MEFFDLFNVIQIIWVSITQAFDVSTLITCLCVAGGVFLGCTVLGGLGMRTMALQRGMGKSWMAFVPFLNTYYAGKLTGTTSFFGSRVKNAGLFAMIAEILFVLSSVFYLVTIIILYYLPAMYGYTTVPVELNWLYKAEVACEVLVSIFQIVMIVFMFVLYTGLFRRYYARGPIVMTILSVVLPFRGLVVFAVRNNTPFDYDGYMRQQMERYNSQRQGGYNNGYDDPYSGEFHTQPTHRAPDDPYSGEFGGSQGSSHSNDSPFDDFD